MPTEATTEPPTLFETDRLGFRYGSRAAAVSEVSLRIQEGEMVGLIGPNGAGKSTLLHLLAGLHAPSSGSARLGGEPIHSIDPLDRARRLAFVPQAPRVSFPYTVAEIVRMGRHPYASALGGMSPADRDRVDWAMEETGVAPLRGRMFNELSGGEAQRVILARALAQEARTLLLDEPTSSLDLFYQAAVYGLLERLNHERKMTILIVTHEINLASEYCPRLIGMRGGSILFDGASDEFMTTENIHRLYGVEAAIVVDGGVRMVRVRHLAGVTGGKAGR